MTPYQQKREEFQVISFPISRIHKKPLQTRKQFPCWGPTKIFAVCYGDGTLVTVFLMLRICSFGWLRYSIVDRMYFTYELSQNIHLNIILSVLLLKKKGSIWEPTTRVRFDRRDVPGHDDRERKPMRHHQVIFRLLPSPALPSMFSPKKEEK